jgi:predicted Zn finger-like uncharacterized protein
MIIVCQKCSTRLQIDEEKAPVRPFTVRCPKCNSTTEAGSTSTPAFEQSALAVGGSPSTEHRRFEQPTAAPVYEIGTQAVQTPESASVDGAVRLLASLLNKDALSGIELTDGHPWKRRKVLVCTAEVHREPIARLLTESGYQVYVAEDTRQAVERMRANQLAVVLLDPQFDFAEQGAAFVVREINVLRPSQRRMLYFALLSPSLRTMDAHSAFLNNVNAVINLTDLEDLPRILDLALRDYNELYKDFNSAFNLAAL